MNSFARSRRIEELELELEDVRAQVARARAATQALTEGAQTGRWRHLQEENAELRARRERLKEEVARLRGLVREKDRRDGTWWFKWIDRLGSG